MIRKYHNHEPQTTLWHREEEPLNHHETPGRQIKQSNQQEENQLTICQSTIIAFIHSVFSQLSNHSTKPCVSQTLLPLCMSIIIAYIHSAFNQPTSHSTNQYISQPSHIYIQFSVNQQSIQQSDMPVINLCTYALSFMSVNHPHIYTLSFSQPFNHLKRLFVSQPLLHLHIQLYVSQP